MTLKLELKGIYFVLLNQYYFQDDLTRDGKENKQSYKELLEGSLREAASLDTEQTDGKAPKKSRHKKTRTLTRYSFMEYC